MVAQLKSLAKKSRTLVIANNILVNWRIKKQFSRGNAESFWGATHTGFSLDQSFRYIETVFQDYLIYSGASPDIFANKRILELGPGDNFGVALKMLAAGAEQVVSIDKFYSERNVEQQQRIYHAVRDELDENSRKRFDEAVNLENGIEFNPEKLVYIYGTGIEEASQKLDGYGPFDLILSRGVLQSVHDLDSAFSIMDGLLVPGGLMWHKMDLRDLGIFRNYDMHPLTFLTVSPSLYKMMVANTGNSNRKLIGYYRKKMEELNYDFKLFITIIVGEENEILPHKERVSLGNDYSTDTIELVNEIRPKLSEEFRNLPDEELLVSGVFLVGRKSGAA